MGLYWLWNGIDDYRTRKDIVLQLAKCGSTARFLWYRRWFSGLFEAYANHFASFIPFTTLVSGLMFFSGFFIEAAMIYLILYCLNLYAMGFMSVKSLFVQISPILIAGLSGSSQTLSFT